MRHLVASSTLYNVRFHQKYNFNGAITVNLNTTCNVCTNILCKGDSCVILVLWGVTVCLMTFEQRNSWEGFVTSHAAVSFHGFVSLHVSTKVWAVGEGSGTNAALIRFLSCIHLVIFYLLVGSVGGKIWEYFFINKEVVFVFNRWIKTLTCKNIFYSKLETQ